MKIKEIAHNILKDNIVLYSEDCKVIANVKDVYWEDIVDKFGEYHVLDIYPLYGNTYIMVSRK